MADRSSSISRRCSTPSRRPRRSTVCATASWSTPRGEWAMPAKVYLDAARRTATSAPCPPAAAGWPSSSGSRRSRSNPAAGLPVVMGVICVSASEDGAPLAPDRRARGHRAAHGGGGRGGGAGAGARGRPDGRHRGLRAARRLGRALPGGSRVRPRRLLRPDPGGARARWPASWAGRPARREDALACDVVTCVTPGFEPVVRVADLRPGMHLNMLGADGPGKAEAEVDVVERARAVLRRVGPGQPRRRADRRCGGRPGGARAGDRAGRRC